MTSSRRRRGRDQDLVDHADWFPFTVPAHEDEPTAEQRSLLEEARELYRNLDPPRARNTWAVLYGGMILVVPLDRKPRADRITSHDSWQLRMGSYKGRSGIAGDWQDAHHAWENPVKRPEFWVDGFDAAARRSALEWLVGKMREPIARRDWRLRQFPAGFFDPW